LGFCSVQLTCGFNLSGSASVNSDDTTCLSQPLGHFCVVPSVSLSAFGGIQLNVITGSFLNATGTVQGSVSLIGGQTCFYDDMSFDSYDTKPYQFCYGDITLTGTVTLISLIDYPVSLVLKSGNCPP
jgi:hypothetical protein